MNFYFFIPSALISFKITIDGDEYGDYMTATEEPDLEMIERASKLMKESILKHLEYRKEFEKDKQ